MAEQVAQTVRERREQLGLTVRALAARSGVSASMISDIERQAKSPTISTLAVLAEALGVSVAALVDVPASNGGPIHVERAAEHSSITDPGSGATRRKIGPVLARGRLEILRYTVPPRSVAGPLPAHARDTLEHVYLAEGSVGVMLGSELVTLNAGDSCTCLADQPHGFDNRTGDATAVLYLVIEPPASSHSPRRSQINS